MLFQRLYNWIKYKTLPTSFLFKNRLFIERDTKNRRIMSNFGLSFRNSKWTNYDSYNIKLQFIKVFLRFIFWILFIVLLFIFLLYFKQYYILFFFFNNISYLFWIGIDTFDYYLTYVFWLIGMSLSLFFNLIYLYFFSNNFSFNSSNKYTFSNKFFLNFNTNTTFPSTKFEPSKPDLNLVMYLWLTDSNSKNNDIVLEELFQTSINKQRWNNYHDFFLKLYKLSYFLNLSSENFNFFNLNSNLNKITNKIYKGDYSKTLHFFNNNSSLNTFSTQLSYYILNNYNNNFFLKNKKNSSLNFINNKLEWNLFNLSQELENYSFLIKNKSGMFFLDDFNYQKFSYFIFNYEEFWTLNLYLKNQLNASKWNRWLYRYSILHRKILRNSHKITLSKKLINSGFFDSKIFNKNVWASEHLINLNNSNNFNSLFSNYYKDLFSINYKNYLNNNLIFLNNGSQKNTLTLLGFYENSYFWYLKRFYLFNTLSTNFIKSKLNKNLSLNKNSQDIFKNNEFSKYSIFLSYFLNSSYNNLSLHSHFNDTNLNFLNYYLNFDNNNFNPIKDLFLLINENDLLSKDNSNLLYWLTSSSNKNNNLVFLNYLNYLKNSNESATLAFLFNKNDIFNLNFWFLYSLIKTDKPYLNDLIYLSLFN